MKTFLRITLLCLLLFTAVDAAALDVPYLTGRVTDNAQIISESMRRSITEQLKAHEEATGNQIAVLTIPTLEGESIENFADEVFKAWKLGKKGKDNGILLIVVPNDRRVRIEVGYGLEGTLPDSAAGSIIRNVMTPQFKNGAFDAGISAGVQAIIAVLKGGQAPEPEQKTKASSGSSMECPDMSLTEKLLFGSFIFGIIGLFTFLGIVTPRMGWFLYFFLIPFWAMFPIVVVGTKGALYLLIAYLVLFPAAKLVLGRTEWYKKAGDDLRTKGHASVGGFTLSSGSSGSSWSSDSSGGSGFSGGGGSSGGGGASGSW